MSHNSPSTAECDQSLESPKPARFCDQPSFGPQVSRWSGPRRRTSRHTLFGSYPGAATLQGGPGFSCPVTPDARPACPRLESRPRSGPSPVGIPPYLPFRGRSRGTGPRGNQVWSGGRGEAGDYATSPLRLNEDSVSGPAAPVLSLSLPVVSVMPHLAAGTPTTTDSRTGRILG
jgi:hypothetical protein